jgi:hypothetical protein
MPGYLTNRTITFNPAEDVAAVEADLAAIDTRVTDSENSIDDLSLDIGV